MIVDTSVISAIFTQEDGYKELIHKLEQVEKAGIGAPTVVECGIVLSVKMGHDSRGALSRFLNETKITTIPFTETHMSIAIGAWLKYGKSRHPANLNFGDCLTYAVAKVANLPLLYIGKDFALTDLIAA